MITEVTKIFDNQLKAKLHSKPEVLKFLISHERKNHCIEKLCEQIRMAELGTINMNVHKYYTMINGVADMFAGTALEQKRQDILSANEKKRIQDEQSRKQEIDELLKESVKDGTTES